MKKYFYIGVALIILMAAALVGYGAYLNYSDEHQIAKRMDERRLEVTGARAMVREFRPVIEMNAMRLYSDSMVDAVALLEGRIVQWQAEKNTAVKKGDILLTMTNEQLPLKIIQAASNVKKAEAVLAKAKNTFFRQKNLWAQNATSLEQYDEAKAQYLAAQEAVTEAKAQHAQYMVQSEQLNVTAPIDGNVLIIYYREGTYVQGGTPLALVGNFDYLRFSATLDDETSRHLQLSDTAAMNFPAEALKKAYDTEYAAGNNGIAERIEAKLIDITPSLDEPAGVRRVVWEIDNRARILEPLTYNGVSMRMNRAYSCLTVPLSAMIDSSHDTVFVADENGIIKKRHIVTGANDTKHIEVYDGLNEGDIVIIESFDGLEDGMKVDITLSNEGDED